MCGITGIFDTRGTRPVSAAVLPSWNSPRANMPGRALLGKSPFAPDGCERSVGTVACFMPMAGRSTYTSPDRVWGSTVGATVRTLPLKRAPLAATTSTGVPGTTLASSDAVISARHSRRPWRISRNSSVPAGTTAPTVALRAEMMPASGASTWVFFNRSSWAANTAFADSTRAKAVCSAARYWLICCPLNVPVFKRVRTRFALAVASVAWALVSATPARACATSACTLSSANRAST